MNANLEALAQHLADLAREGSRDELEEEILTNPIFSDRQEALDDVLEMAIIRNDAVLADAALEMGAALDRSYNGASPVGLAIDVDSPGMLWFLLKKGADPNVRLLNDYTPLHVAASLGNIGLLEVLLADPRTSVDATTRIDSYVTPLMLAAARDKAEAVRTLLSKGAKVDFVNRLGQRASDFASVQCSRIIATWTSKNSRRSIPLT